MSRSDSKQYAPGVKVVECDSFDDFEGHAAPLMAAGVIKKHWLPGEPGNGKGATLVVFDAEGDGIVAPPKSRGEKCEGDFGYLKILKSGNLFHVRKYRPKMERERREAARLAACTNETWRISKDLALQRRDYPAEWKYGAVNEARRVENLVNGLACFDGFPDVALAETDRRSILDALAHLIKTINASTPFVKKAIQTDGNVIRLADRVRQGMRKAI